jgi:hypothetical protein
MLAISMDQTVSETEHQTTDEVLKISESKVYIALSRIPLQLNEQIT